MDTEQHNLFIGALTRLLPGLERKGVRHQCHGPDGKPGAPAGHTLGDVHYHESWEIKIPVRGRLHCRFMERSFDLRQNAVLLIAPKTIHYTTRPSDIRQCDSWFNCIFENGDVRLRLTDGSKLAYYFLSADQKSALTALLGRDPNEFCAQAAVALAHTGRMPPAWMAGKWLSIFFGALLDALVCPPASAPQNEVVSRAIALINNMSGDATLTVRRMAKMLNISPKYLTTVFHRLTGATPRQKLISVRLERAWRLLRAGDFSVKETAALTGWQNQFYFSNSFRRRYGMAPSQANQHAGRKPGFTSGAGCSST